MVVQKQKLFILYLVGNDMQAEIRRLSEVYL